LFFFFVSFFCMARYRVATDQGNVEELYTALTRRGFRVFWDKLCLADGRDWEEGFCDGLVQSRVFIPLLSEAALYKGDKKNKANVSLLKADSDCDNVVLEHAMVLELKQRKLIERVVPVLMDAGVSAERAASVAVCAINDKLASHLQREGLGAPEKPPRNVKEVLSAILAPGPPLPPGPPGPPGPPVPPVPPGDIQGAAAALVALLQRLKCVPRFDVLISFRGGCDDDEQVALELRDALVAKGTRALAAAASTGAEALLKWEPRVVVALESAVALAPLAGREESSLADPVGVEWAVANHLQGQGKLEFVYPVFLGTVDATNKRSEFKAWGGGSDVEVKADQRCVEKALEKALGAPAGSLATLSSSETVATVNQNQGQKVGGKPDFSLETAASKIRNMMQALDKGQAAADELRESRIRIAGLKQREEKALHEKAEAQQREAKAQQEKAVALDEKAKAQQEKAVALDEKAKAQQREAEAQRQLAELRKELARK
jgi:hypothetical protein